MLTGPIALAPEPGSDQAIGEVSGAAEAFGIKPGISISEALGRCPALVLIPADPARAESEWELTLRRLEGVGAAVEPARAGEAFFNVDGLRGLWGPRPEDVLARCGQAVGRSARLGGGASRFSSYAAASTSRLRRDRHVLVVPEGASARFLSPLPITLLHGRLGLHTGAATDQVHGGVPKKPLPPGASSAGATHLIATMQRLGITTLGALASLPRIAVADRFGRLGLRAQDLSSGIDLPLRPRDVHEELEQSLGLPEAAYSHQLERALEMLIERLLADPRRRGRSFRSLRIEAMLAGGGSWRTETTLRSATASAERLRLALIPRLAGLPAPASVLTLRVSSLGPAGAGEQESLGEDASGRRRHLLDEAAHQARAAAGRDAILRVLDVDPDSRLPERQMTLVPRS